MRHPVPVVKGNSENPLQRIEETGCETAKLVPGRSILLVGILPVVRIMLLFGFLNVCRHRFDVTSMGGIVCLCSVGLLSEFPWPRFATSLLLTFFCPKTLEERRDAWSLAHWDGSRTEILVVVAREQLQLIPLNALHFSR